MTGLTDLRDIVRKIGGDIYAGGNAATVPGPGHSKEDRSLSLRLTTSGRVLFYSHANDAVLDCMKHLGLDGLEAKPADKAEWAAMRRAQDEERRRQRAADQAFCQEIWAGTTPIEGTLAESYLWSRALVIDDCSDIRFHAAAPRGKPRAEGDERPLPDPHPAMVSVVRDREGGSMSLHLTYLALDGQGKAPFGRHARLMFGPQRGGAVHLTRPGAVLAVGEGIESCAAYRAIKGLPTWAALTTSQYASFAPPRCVRKLVICADRDDSGGGMKAATMMAERLSRQCDVEIDPAPEGEDWADVWLRRSGARNV